MLISPQLGIRPYKRPPAAGAGLVPTGRGNWAELGSPAWASSSASTRVSDNFTPSNNSVLCAIFAGIVDTADPTGTPAIAGGSLSWTKRVEIVSSGLFSTWLYIIIWTAPVGTGASMAVTFSNLNAAGTFFTGSGHFLDLTGYNTGSPTGATASGQNLGNDAVNLTLSGSPASGSYVIGASAFTTSDSSSRSATPGSGWTELYDTGAANNYTALQTQYRTGSTSTDVAWSDIADGGDSSFGTCSVAAALEIKAA